MKHLRVGARGSDLSLAQTKWTIARVIEANPGLTAEIVIIHTHGDRDQTTPLAELATPGGFVKDIERALLAGEIDCAIHSLKDVPTQDTPGLTVAAMPKRAMPEDVMLTREPANIRHLPEGFVVGTSSPRRTHQVLRWNPLVKTVPLRGNVPTRIRHMEEGAYDAIMLAGAGLERLGISHRNVTVLPASDFLPAPGQGCLAVQTRADGPARALVARIDDAPSRAAVTAERAFLEATGGGCHAALGALAKLHAGVLRLEGELFTDGRHSHANVHGSPTEAADLGRRLAAILAPAAVAR